jgi:lipopolysaccharide/colanic/teichoic acid biosynthesis glycosyltransferase
MEAVRFVAGESHAGVEVCELEWPHLWGKVVGSAPAAVIVKRAIDLIGSAISLVLLSPLLLLISLLVLATSPGPVLFRQHRLGYRGRPFCLLKFRTMVVDAERWLAKLEARDGAAGEVFFKIRHDPRITPLGRFLRRTSLDELPQLWNVLRGEMSLVGPRPFNYRDSTRLRHFDPLRFGRRLAARPGVSGLAQVSGRRDLPPERILAYDLFYVEHWSLVLDLSILLRTLVAVASGRGAY